MLLSLKLLVGLAALIGMGRFVCTLTRIDAGRPIQEKAALWFLLGCASASLLVFWLSFLRSTTALRAAAIFGLCCVLAACANAAQSAHRYVLARRAGRPRRKAEDVSRAEAWFNLTLSSVLLIQALSISFAVIFTAVGWDGIMNWGIKAKVFFVHGGVPLSYFTDMSMVGSHLNYPLLVPISEAWVYLFAGDVNERLVKLFFLGMLLSLLGLFYAAIRREHSTRYAIGFTLLLCVTPAFLKIGASGYADVPLSAFMFGGAAYTYYWLRHGKSSDLILAAVLSALAMWVKREGMIFWGINLVAVVMWAVAARGRSDRPRLASVIKYVAPALVMLPWYAMLALKAVPDADFASASLPVLMAQIDRVPVLTQLLVTQITSIDSWGVLWVLFVLATLYRIRKPMEAAEAYLFCSVTGHILVVTFLYVFSTMEGGYVLHANSSLDRLLLQVVPTSVFFIATMSRPALVWLGQRTVRVKTEMSVGEQGSGVQYP